MNCDHYIQFLFYVGSGTLILGIALGVALAIVTLILLLRQPPPTPSRGELVEAAPAALSPTAILEAAKAFLQALTSAPTWLALFGAGVLLLWMAGTMTPARCSCPPDTTNCARAR